MQGSSSARDLRAGIEMDTLSSLIKAEKLKEKKEVEEYRSRFTKRVLHEHEVTERAASASSQRAREEIKRSNSARLEALEVIETHKEQVEEFDNKMKTVIADENERIQVEAELEEEIK